MSDWTPAELAAEAERRAELESRGICPDSGSTIHWCWHSDLCDCAYTPPDRCRNCGIAVWNMPDHHIRRHPPDQGGLAAGGTTS